MMGCGFQAGEQGMNVGRNALLLSGIDHHVPATTVNRFCASSLQTLRMAFHAISTGEGDQYIAAGVEAESQDEWAATSQQCAVAARESGHFDREIVAVTLEDGTEQPWLTLPMMEAQASQNSLPQ